MSRPCDDFTDAKAKAFVDIIKSGKRVTYAAEQIGVCRATVYNWKKQHEDFSQAWNDATSYANERMEEVVYDMGINGDLAAAMWWLRNWKPAIYAKETLIKLLLAQAQLANGGNLELDEDGSIVSVPTGNGKTGLNSGIQRRVVILPANGRADYPDPDKLARVEEVLQARQAANQAAPGAGHKLPRVMSLEEQEARVAQLQASREPVSEPVESVPEVSAVEPEIILPEPQASSVVPMVRDVRPSPMVRRWQALSE